MDGCMTLQRREVDQLIRESTLSALFPCPRGDMRVLHQFDAFHQRDRFRHTQTRPSNPSTLLTSPAPPTNIIRQHVDRDHQCLRQLSLPWSPLVVLRSESRGMSREGGPESAFRLACALEGAGVVVMDAGAGRMFTKVWYCCFASAGEWM